MAYGRYMYRRRTRRPLKYVRRSRRFRNFRRRMRGRYRSRRRRPLAGKSVTRRSVNSVSRNRMTFDNIRAVTMCYFDVFSLTVNAGGATRWHILDLANITDVDVTGVGHQPYGHDEIAGLYNQWCVIGARIQVEYVVSAGQTSGADVGMYLYPTREAAASHIPSTNPGTIIESNFGPTAHVLPGADFPEDARKRLSLDVNVAKYLDVHPRRDNEDWTLFANNPPSNQTCYCFVWAGNSFGASTQVSCRYRIYYRVLVRQLKSFTQS